MRAAFWKREKFVALVVVLDEGAHDLGGLRDELGPQRFARVEPAQELAVDEQEPAQHAVLAHEVLGRRDLVLVLRGHRRRGGEDGEGHALPKELSA